MLFRSPQLSFVRGSVDDSTLVAEDLREVIELRFYVVVLRPCVHGLRFMVYDPFLLFVAYVSGHPRLSGSSWSYFGPAFMLSGFDVRTPHGPRGKKHIVSPPHNTVIDEAHESEQQTPETLPQEATRGGRPHARRDRTSALLSR